MSLVVLGVYNALDKKKGGGGGAGGAAEYVLSRFIQICREYDGDVCHAVSGLRGGCVEHGSF